MKGLKDDHCFLLPQFSSLEPENRLDLVTSVERSDLMEVTKVKLCGYALHVTSVSSGSY